MSTLIWDEVNFSIKKKKEQRPILINTFGIARRGELVGILGPSGAGKSTLLAALGGRIASTGFLSLDGRDVVRGDVIFITQDDLIYESLTVKESVEFNVSLRNPQPLSKEEVNERTQQALQRFRLQNVADSIIGNPQSSKGHISGGERKRTCIAGSLQSNAPIVLVDEPTSGLDSYSALQVIEILKEVSEERICIVVIHQPSLELFLKFDRVLVLSEKGRVLYLDSPRNMPDVLSLVGLGVPDEASPQEFAIDIATPALNIASDRQLRELESIARESVDIDPNPGDNAPVEEADLPPFGRQYRKVFKRNVINFKRNPMFLTLRFFSCIFVGLLAGLVFLNLDYTQAGARNRQGAIIFILLSTAFSAQQGVLLLFPTERYDSCCCFLIAEKFSEGSAYYMINLRGGFERLLLLWILTALVVAAAESLGLLITAITGDTHTSLVITPNVLVLLMLFSGFFLTLDNVPAYFAWVPPISYIRWAFNAALISEFRGVEFTCTPEEELPGGLCPITQGEQVLALLGIGTFSIFVSIVFLITMYVQSYT
ncbi:hypothetical protein RCL1_005241 [Eukaryota sp. TZLM3-RCL]